MSKKHYIKIANIFAKRPDSLEKENTLSELADFFMSDNENFDRGLFLEACKYKEVKV